MPKTEMSRNRTRVTDGITVPIFHPQHSSGCRNVKRILESMQTDFSSPERLMESLPFSVNDTTAGTENELQAAVSGRRSEVDLAITIEQSNFLADIRRRMNSGDVDRSVLNELDSFLGSTEIRIWENSWVRFPVRLLNSLSRRILARDMLADKQFPGGWKRKDAERFLFTQHTEDYLRVPISYMIKLALADTLSQETMAPDSLRKAGCQLLDHFSNDNTSPETCSFYVSSPSPQNGMGKTVAREMAKRFLVTQILAQYANTKFRLRIHGQQALIYASPTTPVRQKELNSCISDSFYRHLFMSPCLSGWDRGEEKHGYMVLCHQVLSRSQLNAVAKLREAGIVTRNLVVLPSMSNTSLANNGVHLSLGSKKITQYCRHGRTGSEKADEKYLGDLTIKIMEHFLPLFVGTYSAAPYRMDFCDFHPEKALSFLPHELDYTHLRMIWHQWKKKSRVKVLGRPITPLGPPWLDNCLRFLFRLKGDFLSDYRLIDYFVSLMSTERSPALDGNLGNGDRLKSDLNDLGVFDKKMSLYLLCRLREYHISGFSGFEGRHYSLFPGHFSDFAPSADLQILLQAITFQYLAQGRINHSSIPDTPFVESERRQIFFSKAIGLPSFFVRETTPNLFLKEIVRRCRNVRASRTYSGYLHVYHKDYSRTLLEMIQEDAPDLLQALQLEGTLRDLKTRLEDPDEYGACGKLTRSILKEIGVSSVLSVKARDFNLAAEDYYRNRLRHMHMREGLQVLEEDLCRLNAYGLDLFQEWLRTPLGKSMEADPIRFLRSVEKDLLSENLYPEKLLPLLHLALITILTDIRQAETDLQAIPGRAQDEAPIYRAAER